MRKNRRLKFNPCNGELLPTGEIYKGIRINLGWNGSVGEEKHYETEYYACEVCGHKVQEDFAEYQKMKCHKSIKRN